MNVRLFWNAPLNDCFQLGVESACNNKNRGGFEGFSDSFLANQMSNGTLKMLA